MKYKRFIDVAGGWDVFQELLGVAKGIADKHGVSLSNVASRWVLEHDCVAATIIGARITEAEHRASNLNVFSFALDDDDKAALEGCLCQDDAGCRGIVAMSIASRLSSLRLVICPITSMKSRRFIPQTPDAALPDRARVFTGSVWEPIAGYCRAVRVEIVFSSRARPQPTAPIMPLHRTMPGCRRPIFLTRSSRRSVPMVPDRSMWSGPVFI